jgi:bifunctional enzyme CysN/CysC
MRLERTAEAVRERMNIVIGGHVDHGKSTIVGRLLADTNSLPEGKLEAVRLLCERTAKPFEYAFLLDALKDERAQGITIDSARVFFKSGVREYIIIDAPGHIEFLKNMVTGAARAEAALLVIDASEGIKENSRRHGYMMGMLGIRQVAVLVNKMDLVGHDPALFAQIEADYRTFLAQLDIHPSTFVPVSGRDGDNIAVRSEAMSWYQGPTALEALDAFQAERPPVDKAFRMPVQDVYKFTKLQDDRRIVAGTVEAGSAKVGDEIVFYPSGKKSRIRSVEVFNRAPAARVAAGEAAGFTLQQQIYVTRGELATLAIEPRPEVSSRFRVSLFWLGQKPLVKKHAYTLKIGSARVSMRVEEIHRVIDASDLSSNTRLSQVDRHGVAECTITCTRAIAFDRADQLAATSRFVIVDDYEIAGGGLIREALSDRQEAVRQKVLLRNYKWEPSSIASDRRAARFAQRPTMVIITGPKEADRKGLARLLEASLFDEGRVVYFLGIGNVLYGLDADLARSQENRQEHMRRLAEAANLMLDAGLILIVTAQNLTQHDLDLIKTTVDSDRIETVWVGEPGTTELEYDLVLFDQESDEASVDRIKTRLRDKGVTFKPW